MVKPQSTRSQVTAALKEGAARETWPRTPHGWKLYRVDNVRDQRRLLDGQPG